MICLHEPIDLPRGYTVCKLCSTYLGVCERTTKIVWSKTPKLVRIDTKKIIRENPESSGMSARVRENNRKLFTKTCKVCVNDFTGHKTAAYCSDKCRDEQKRQRDEKKKHHGRGLLRKDGTPRMTLEEMYKVIDTPEPQMTN